MKRYYSATIPVELGLKLQDAGMQIDWEDNTPDEYRLTPDVGCLTTYAEVFDRLMEKGLEVEVRLSYIHLFEWCSKVFRPEEAQSREKCKMFFTLDWFEAANTGIENALKMLKEGKK